MKESCIVEKNISSVKKNYSFVFGFEVLAIRGKYCLNMRCMYFLEGKLYC